MKKFDFSKLSKDEIIKELNMQKVEKDFTKKPYPKGVEVWESEKETAKAKYHYNLNNMFNLSDDEDFWLVVERYSKTATVYSTLFRAYIPRKTIQSYHIQA